MPEAYHSRKHFFSLRASYSSQEKLDDEKFAYSNEMQSVECWGRYRKKKGIALEVDREIVSNVLKFECVVLNVCLLLKYLLTLKNAPPSLFP